MKKNNFKNNKEKQTKNFNNTKNKREQTNQRIMRYENKNMNFDDQVEGRNSVLELLESGKDINKIFVARGEKQGSINKIIGKAKD